MRIIVIFVLFSSPLFSNPIIKVTVEPTIISIDEIAKISVSIINEKAQEPPYPSTNSDNFDIVYKDLISQRQFAILDGFRTVNTYNFTFTPKTSGYFNIPTFVVTTKQDNQVYSPSATITVQDTSPWSQGFSRSWEYGFDAFIILDIKQSTITQNTGALVNLYIYSSDNKFFTNTDNMKVFSEAKFNGGVIYKYPINNNKKYIKKKYGYKTYYGKLIQTYLIFSSNTGILYLQPPIFSIPQQGRWQRFIKYGFAADEYGSLITGETILINSLPITDSLSYIGNNLSISHSLSKSTNTSGEITLNLSIEGDGNVDLFIDPLKSRSISNAYIDSPSSSIEIKKSANFFDNIKRFLSFDKEASSYLRMKKTFSYTIKAKKSGQVILPEIKLNFFTKTGQMTNIVYPSTVLNIK